MKRVLLIFFISLAVFILVAKYLSLSADEKVEFLDIDFESFSSSDVEETAKYFSPINIKYLRTLKYDFGKPMIEEELPDGSNYKRYIVSYKSYGYKIYGLLTVPNEEPPEGGFSAIVFNHGYIPPHQYATTEKYVSYVDNLAKNGFVVFKIDLRGHGKSEGTPSSSYFSPVYMMDALNALKSLQKLDYVNPDKIGMWGHSMSGNLVLRAMLVSDEIKAGVIWSGAVYSYKDFSEYGLHDTSYVRSPRTPEEEEAERDREPTRTDLEIQKLMNNPEEIDFDDEFWAGISLTKNIEYLENPVQLHHAVNDPVVDISYSRDLEKVLIENDKEYEFYEYEGGGHNIESPHFETAMQRTVDFFNENLESE
ncbi:alpha/beta hydrolase [Patescibacteria group bacterium]|nr:alpha/beta hydrolase [Patescibacteria group bacterium]